MDLPIRVLQGFVANFNSGVTKYICDNYLNIDRSRFQFDFLYSGDPPTFLEEFEKMGARFYKIPHTRQVFRYLVVMTQIMQREPIGIVHLNLSFSSILPLIAAKLAKAKVIIVHAHSTKIDVRNKWMRAVLYLYHKISMPFVNCMSTDYFACSNLAGEWLFGKQMLFSPRYKVLNNAIDCEYFDYNPRTRQEIRERENCGKKVIIGHVGRMTYQKNHDFLLDIFAEAVKNCPDSELWLIGKGELLPNIEHKIAALGLCEKVRLMGIRNDINKLMQAIDVFVLPSRFEGLPIVGVEAQASGLPCVMSDAITREVDITGRVRFISQKDSAKEWADAIQGVLVEFPRISVRNILENAGYSRTEQIKKLEGIYQEMWEREFHEIIV